MRVIETTALFHMRGHTNWMSLLFNLKYDLIRAKSLHQYYPAVLPGYHMNKRYWKIVVLDGTKTEVEICGMIDDSYAIVLKAQTKAKWLVP